MLVRSGGVLTARDAATGERLWAFTEPVRPAVLVSGVLVAQGAGEVIARDLADGTVLWRADLAGEEQTMGLAGTAVTSDGTLVGCQDGTSLVARGLADGRERWRSPLPDGALWSAVLSDGTLVVGGAGRLSALR